MAFRRRCAEAHAAVRKFRAQFAMDLRHFPDGFVEHRRESRSEHDAYDLLRLAERVAEQHGHCTGVEGLAAEIHDACGDLGARRHDVARQAEGRLHHERVRATPLAALGGEARRELEVARVEQRSCVRFKKDLRRSEDVPRGQQRRAPGGEFTRLAECRDVLGAIAAEPLAHEARGRRSHQHFVMPRDVIAVRVRDECERLPAMRIEPQPVIRKVQSALVEDRDQAAHSRRFPRSRANGSRPSLHATAVADQGWPQYLKRNISACPSGR